LKKDLELANIYDKFDKNRHDYGESARDTILNRFKTTLLKTLSNKEFANFPFDSLSKNIKIVTSKDKKLKIFSWDELSGGTRHNYNSAYQYNDKKKSYSGLLTSETGLNGNLFFDDIIHLKIFQLPETKYLVVGYGTHGAGREFYTFRLLSFIDNKIVDCTKCFDKKDRFVFIIPRGDKAPIYDEKSKIILFSEYKEDEETGFLHKTGEVSKMKLIKNSFIKLDD
jgi:hypothetical protein